MKVWGKSYQPLRKSCSYGDMDLEYEYSGHCELQLPWNRTMLKIKSDVEKKTGFEYNFVLLNFYESGHAKIGAHKDDEASLDQSVDIATLSFGACRDMIFSKKGCKSVLQEATRSVGSKIPLANARTKGMDSCYPPSTLCERTSHKSYISPSLDFFAAKSG
ncbi:DNA oxidative demethylase ALKBH2 [Araneus ventricosus]|uniref:DNA oxidative demethylase ALKBH2 n=1 Tax=Araneus ventricosus TaxID=182803 RepID=A0A4Y2AQK5_ARAVE|nr:DNA oxidative demethylase ALKBH2 [Araneus ventricosus]